MLIGLVEETGAFTGCSVCERGDVKRAADERRGVAGREGSETSGLPDGKRNVWVPAALIQVSVKFLALSKLAHGLHNGLGIMAVKAQICWWPELKGVSAGGRCPSL